MLFIVFLYNLLYFYKMSGNIPSFICESFFFLLCWPVQLNVVNFIDLFKEANIGLVDYLIFLLFISLIFFSSFYFLPSSLGFPCGSAVKESAFNGGDLGSFPGLGRSPREEKGYPLQYSGLENSMLQSMGSQRIRKIFFL